MDTTIIVPGDALAPNLPEKILATIQGKVRGRGQCVCGNESRRVDVAGSLSSHDLVPPIRWTTTAST